MVRRAHVDADDGPLGYDVGRAGRDRDLADGRNGAGHRKRSVACAEHELGGVDERVAPSLHRRRARVSRRAFEDDLATRETDDRADDAERRLAAQEHRPLFDVHLDVDLGLAHEPEAAAEAALLVAERDDSDWHVDPLRGFDAREHTEGAVVAAAVGDRVEVGAGPDTRIAARADEVPGGVGLDGETGLAHPAGGELVRAVFLRRVADAIADRVDLLDPFQQAHETFSTRKPVSDTELVSDTGIRRPDRCNRVANVRWPGD